MNFVHIHEIKFRLLTTYSFRFASLGAVWGISMAPEKGVGVSKGARFKQDSGI